MYSRIYDAVIVLIAAFSQPILARLEPLVGYSVPTEWRFLATAVIGLVIFTLGLAIESFIYNSKFVRKHLIRDKRAHYMGHWVDSFKRGDIIFYGDYRIGYSVFQKGYFLSGHTYSENGKQHAIYNSVSIIFPYQEEREELRYQYIGTILEAPMKTLYGTGHMFFSMQDEAKGWFRDEDDAPGTKEVVDIKLIDKTLLTLIEKPDVRVRNIGKRGDVTREFIRAVHAKRDTVFDLI